MGTTRRKFKTEAAHRVIDTGRPVVDVAGELSIDKDLKPVAVEIQYVLGHESPNTSQVYIATPRRTGGERRYPQTATCRALGQTTKGV
jgi:hypothetical protein